MPPDDDDRQPLPRGAGTRPLKVLVIDDERDLAELAGALLAFHAVDNTVVYSAAAALAVLATDPAITAVFSDITMPDMSGIELAGEIRRRFPDLHVVLTSGHAPPGMLAGRDRLYRFAPKPYRIETIIGLLARGIAGHQA
ncbi:response regulator [Pseudoduganella sp. SL102]|uniref:response regulator n=1 Tax=Pseudoduganella sp. SL102 TaxID=2995154 RepID=UPI00248B07D0|nr:response regulator [Pseudoduganella sp. SL102]WBS05809.1 response regulator [Pseudoduganella sp. SL102]